MMKKLIIFIFTAFFSFTANSTIVEPGSLGTPLINKFDRQTFDFSPHVRFGEIERVDSSSLGYPGRTVGKLIGPFGVCTATLVAEQYIATAAHCFWRKGKVVNKIAHGTYTFHHSYHNSRYLDSAYVTKIWYDPLYEFSYHKKYDWVVAKLSKPLGKTLGYLGFSYNLPNVHLENSYINIIGYGMEFENGQTQTQHKNCRIFKDASQDELIFHDCDTSFGDSGAPIIKEINGKLYLIAIHTSGGSISAGTTHFKEVSSKNSNVATFSKKLFQTIKKARNNTLTDGTPLNGTYNDIDANFYYIIAENACDEEINLAINYLNPKTYKWDTLYWYTIKPNGLTKLGTKSSFLQTKNRKFYYYAKAKSYTWTGRNHSESINKKVGETLLSMRLNQIEEQRWGEYTLKITCNK